MQGAYHMSRTSRPRRAVASLLLLALFGSGCVGAVVKTGDNWLVWAELARSGTYSIQPTQITATTNEVSKALAGMVLGGVALGALGAAAGSGMGLLDDAIAGFRGSGAEDAAGAAIGGSDGSR